jgi:hypothetical protein
MVERQVIPPDLAEMPPGPELAAVLAGIDRARVSGFDCVELLTAWARQCNHDTAQLLGTMAEVGICDVAVEDEGVARLGEPGEFAADEVRAALALTRRAAAARFDLAYGLATRLPAVLVAMEAGQVDEPRARVLFDWTIDLTDEQAREVAERLLPEVGELTTGQLIERVKKLAIALDPDWARRRYEAAMATRKVVGSRNPDGSANLSGLNLPVERVVDAGERIARLAAAAKRAGHPDPVDHVRADLYLGMLDGSYGNLDDEAILERLLADVPAPPATIGAATPRRSGTELRVRLSTLLRRDRLPAELAGWGPVHAELARHLAKEMGTAQWRYVLTDAGGRACRTGLLRARPGDVYARGPRSGCVVELQVPITLLAELLSTAAPAGWETVLAELARHLRGARIEPSCEHADQRFPGAALRRYLEVRDRHCMGPGCRAPARGSDLDHTRGHACGGTTVEDNLQPLCRHDHRLKHDGGWALRQPEPGRFVWTSRLGHTYPIDPPPIMEPLPEPAPAPEPDGRPPPF